jgi:hypothetical protein
MFISISFATVLSGTRGENDVFLAVVLGMGHTKWPLVLSAQINTTLTTTIAPKPKF